MTKKTLEKLTDRQKGTLTTFQTYYRLSKDNENRVDEAAWKGRILGYAESIRDSGQITERERMAIVIYYTL